MKTRREALVEAGLAKPGRGKFSTAAKAWLDTQRSKGVKFSDDEAPVKASKPTGPKSEKAPAPKVDQYPDYIYPSDFRYPEDEYIAVARVNGKRVVHSMRECCNTCRVSLVNHGCDNPTIHDSIAVKIERR